VTVNVDPGALADVADELRAIQLPEKHRRQRIREDAGLSLRAMAAYMARLGVDVTAETIRRWEQGVTPRREHAVVYRQLLDTMEAAGE
jgi:DNA-binding transcriptional regulator YiaG